MIIIVNPSLVGAAITMRSGRGYSSTAVIGTLLQYV
jgi:hypothetical protein